MTAVQPFKPFTSAIVTLFWLGAFVFINTSSTGFLQKYFYFDANSASAVKWSIILIIGLVWFLLQLFVAAPAESTRLSLALSLSILWLGLILFYKFSDPAYGGPVAFFALVGGLAVVVIWTRYLSDEF